jgi:hypothetical protein
VDGSFTGSNNIVGTDPGFVRNPYAGADGTWGTADDDYGDLRLLATSAGINAGDNELLPEDTWDLDGDGNVSETIPIDMAGHPRIGDSVVDIGAYEFVRAGDADGDGIIAGVDLALWQINYDPLGLNDNTWGMGDWNGDGKINGTDLAFWQVNYDPIGAGGLS